jgi:hypothetical protein
VLSDRNKKQKQLRGKKQCFLVCPPLVNTALGKTTFSLDPLYFNFLKLHYHRFLECEDTLDANTCQAVKVRRRCDLPIYKQQCKKTCEACAGQSSAVSIPKIEETTSGIVFWNFTKHYLERARKKPQFSVQCWHHPVLDQPDLTLTYRNCMAWIRPPRKRRLYFICYGNDVLTLFCHFPECRDIGTPEFCLSLKPTCERQRFGGHKRVRFALKYCKRTCGVCTPEATTQTKGKCQHEQRQQHTNNKRMQHITAWSNNFF